MDYTAFSSNFIQMKHLPTLGFDPDGIAQWSKARLGSWNGAQMALGIV